MSHEDQNLFDALLPIIMESITDKAKSDGTNAGIAFNQLFLSGKAEKNNAIIGMTFEEFNAGRPITMSDFCMMFCYNFVMTNKRYKKAAA